VLTPLYLADVRVTDLRCHAELRWQCVPGINLLVGENGSGKTTLLEAANLMSHGRSFRQARDPYLVRRGQECFRIDGHWRRYGPLHVQVEGRRGGAEIRLQGRKIRQRRDLTRSIPVLVEAPQGRRLIDGVPNERRRWLDALLTDCRDSLVSDYQRYGRSMMQRSRLLRRGAASGEVDAWEQQIVVHGIIIAEARQLLIRELNKALAAEEGLTESQVEIATRIPGYDRDAWLKRLRDKRSEDARTGRLDYGPHADRIHILYQGREIRSSGSRGQQKLASVALKLAECAVRGHHRQMMPVLLLDDCLEALDAQRQQRLLRRLGGFSGQILMTAPAGVPVPAGIDVCVQYLDGEGVHADGQAGQGSMVKIGGVA
jgi:DNA replication and repair protein RecF